MKLKLLYCEDAPPGFSGTVKAMKKHGDIEEPYALAWHMYKKGAKPGYKPERGKPRYIKPETWQKRRRKKK